MRFFVGKMPEEGRKGWREGGGWWEGESTTNDDYHGNIISFVGDNLFN